MFKKSSALIIVFNLLYFRKLYESGRLHSKHKCTISITDTSPSSRALTTLTRHYVICTHHPAIMFTVLSIQFHPPYIHSYIKKTARVHDIKCTGRWNVLWSYIVAEKTWKVPLYVCVGVLSDISMATPSSCLGPLSHSLIF